MNKILAYRMTYIPHDQGDYVGDSIAELMWFDSVDDFNAFINQPRRKYEYWAIVETWKNPNK